MNKVEAIFRKGTNAEIASYSAFFDIGHVRTTALGDYLRGRKVKEVFIAGLAGDFCVYYIAKDALIEQFSTFIIEDAVRAINTEGFEKAKQHIVEQGGSIVNSCDIK